MHDYICKFTRGRTSTYLVVWKLHDFILAQQ